jgi:hypothetical protein
MTDRDPSLSIMSLLPEVPQDDAIERAARERVRARLREHVVPAPTPRRFTRRPRMVLGGAAGAAGAAAVVALALTSGLNDGHVAPAPSSAATVLRQTAAAAERAPAIDGLGSGQYLYAKRTMFEPRTIHRRGETFTAYIRYVEEDWTARDGSGRNRSSATTPAFPTAGDRAAWERAGRPSTRTMVGNYVPIMASTDHRAAANARRAFPARTGGSGLSYHQVRTLPTAPRALERRLRSRLSSVRAFTPQTRAGVARVQLLQRIGSLLSGAPLRATQRAALLRVAAAQPGVRLSHAMTDRLGRAGTAVRLDALAILDPSRPPHKRIASRRSMTLIVDPTSGALLGTRVVLAAESGKVTGDYGAVYHSAVVGSTTQRR